jgi:hypothetical protein
MAKLIDRSGPSSKVFAIDGKSLSIPKIVNKNGRSKNRKEFVIGDPDWEPQDWKNPDFDTSPKNP